MHLALLLLDDGLRVVLEGVKGVKEGANIEVYRRSASQKAWMKRCDRDLCYGINLIVLASSSAHTHLHFGRYKRLGTSELSSIEYTLR